MNATMTIHDLEIGDECYRLNAARTRAVECVVVKVNRRSVGVIDANPTNPADKGRTYFYDREDGTPAGGGALTGPRRPVAVLVLPDDPEVQSTLDGTNPKAVHFAFQQKAVELIGSLPGSADDWDALYTVLEEWEDYSKKEVSR